MICQTAIYNKIHNKESFLVMKLCYFINSNNRISRWDFIVERDIQISSD